MKYLLFWKDSFGRECHSEKPEIWENIEPILNTIRKSGHYQEKSFHIDFVKESENE